MSSSCILARHLKVYNYPTYTYDQKWIMQKYVTTWNIKHGVHEQMCTLYPKQMLFKNVISDEIYE